MPTADCLGTLGFPITTDNTSVEYYCTIFAALESPHEPGAMWCDSPGGDPMPLGWSRIRHADECRVQLSAPQTTLTVPMRLLASCQGLPAARR
jgi:hypothetical protein